MTVMVSEGMADEEFVSLATGKLVDLVDVPDATFAQKMLGDDFAIDIQDGCIVAPFSGRLKAVFPSGHAFGIEGELGELLHVGIGTVELDGDGFDVKVKQGDMVKRGDILVKVDIERIKELGKLPLTMIIFTDGKAVHIPDMKQSVQVGKPCVIE